MFRLVFLIISIVVTIYFWTTVPDAIKGISLLDHPNPMVRLAIMNRGYGVPMLIVRTLLSIGFTILSVWLAWPIVEKLLQ